MRRSTSNVLTLVVWLLIQNTFGVFFFTCFNVVFLSTIGIAGNIGNKKNLVCFILAKGALKATLKINGSF